MTPRLRRVLLPGVLAVALATAVAGCTSNPIENIVGGAVDQAVEEAVGGPVDVSTDGNVPDGFPEAVPLVEGTVIGGAGGGDLGWTVAITADSIDRFAEAQTALEEAGFTTNTSNADTDSAFGSYSGNGHNVQLTFATDTDGVVTAVYVVTAA
jgi:hypothetical protein